MHVRESPGALFHPLDRIVMHAVGHDFVHVYGIKKPPQPLPRWSIILRGACQDLLLAGMSMKKLSYFKFYLKQRPVTLSDNIVVL